MDSQRIPSGMDVKLLAGRDPRQEEIVGGHTKITQRAVINQETKTITLFVDTADYQHAPDKSKFIISKIKEQLRNIDQTPKGVTHRSDTVKAGNVKPSALKGDFHERMISISQGKRAAQPLEHQSAHVGKGKVDNDVIKQLDESLKGMSDDIYAFTEVRVVLQDELDHLTKELKHTRSQSNDYREPLKQQIATIAADYDNRIAKQKEHDKDNGVDPKKGSKELHNLVEEKAKEIDRASMKVSQKEGQLIQEARDIERKIEDITSKIESTDKSIRELSNTYATIDSRKNEAVSEKNKDAPPKLADGKEVKKSALKDSGSKRKLSNRKVSFAASPEIHSAAKPAAQPSANHKPEAKSAAKPLAASVNLKDIAESKKNLKPGGKANLADQKPEAKPAAKPSAPRAEHKPEVLASHKAPAANLRQSSENLDLDDDFVKLGDKPAAPQREALKEAVEGPNKKEERSEDVHLNRSMGASGRKAPSRKKRDISKP